MSGTTREIVKGRKVWTKPAVRWLDAQADMVKRTPNVPHTIHVKEDGRLAAEDIAGYLGQKGILCNIGKDSDKVYALYEKKEKKNEEPQV